MQSVHTRRLRVDRGVRITRPAPGPRTDACPAVASIPAFPEEVSIEPEARRGMAASNNDAMLVV